MAVALLPPFCQPSPRHAFWLCMVVLLLWSTSLVSAQEEYRRVYKVKDIGDKPLKDMADGMKRCADWVGGELAIADTLEKKLEIEYAVDLHRTENNITRQVWTMLGGSLSGKRCNQNTAQLPGHCFWCWDYGTGNCGANNESMIGTGLSPNYKPFGDHFNNWEPGHPYVGSKHPFMYYNSSIRRWWSERATNGTDLLCVVKKPIIDSLESSSNSRNVSVSEPTTASSWFTKWWAPLAFIAGLLVVVTIVTLIVFFQWCVPKAEEQGRGDWNGPVSDTPITCSSWPTLNMDGNTSDRMCNVSGNDCDSRISPSGRSSTTYV